MTFDMMPMHVDVGVGNERFPQVFVFDRIAGTGLPAVFAPSVDPFGNPVDEILTICVDMNGMITRRLLESDECRGEFHPVIRCIDCAAAEFGCTAVVEDNGRPTATSRVAGTGAVGDNVGSIHAVPCTRVLMRRILLLILTCFVVAGCAATQDRTNVPDPVDAIPYRVSSTSSLPEVMAAYDNNLHAMLRAKGYRVTDETSFVRIPRPIAEVAQSYDDAARANDWSIDPPLPPRDSRILRTYRNGTQILIVTLFAEANTRDGVVSLRITADR